MLIRRIAVFTQIPLNEDSQLGLDAFFDSSVDRGIGLYFLGQYPEHHRDGIAGMNLIDLLEMVADWKASCERSSGGDIHKSLDINTRRFKIEPQLKMILLNTINDLICGIEEDTI